MLRFRCILKIDREIEAGILSPKESCPSVPASRKIDPQKKKKNSRKIEILNCL